MFTGTHQGPYFGVPPSGADMVNRVAWMSHYDDQGLMTYAAFHWNDLGVLMQLGAIPNQTAVQAATWGAVKAHPH